MNPLLAYGVRNLRRSARRTLLTGASVALGCGGLVFTFGYIHRVARYMEVAHAFTLGNGHLSLYKAPGYDVAHLTPAAAAFNPGERAELEALLDEDPAIARYIPILVGAGMMSNACRAQPFYALGIAPTDLAWIWSQPEVLSQTPELGAVSAGETPWQAPAETAPLLITPGLATLLDKPAVRDPSHPGEPVFVDCDAPDALTTVRADPFVQLVSKTWDGSLGAQDATVVGHYSTGFTEYESASIWAPMDTLQSLYNTQDISYEAIYLKDRTEVATVQARLETALQKARINAVVYPWWSPVTSPNYTSMMPLIEVMGGFIAIVMVWVVALALVNAMTLAVLERTREMGTLRAVGYTPRALLGVVMAEAGLLSAVGAAFGAGGAVAGARLVNGLNLRFSPPGIAGSIAFQVRPEPIHVVAAVALVLAVCALSAVVAARSQVGRKVVDLLAG